MTGSRGHLTSCPQPVLSGGSAPSCAPEGAGPRTQQHARPHAAGKFIAAGGEKLIVRGVTYGTFAGSDELPDPDVVAADFAAMAANAINAVRVYTVPPRWLLELADEQGLHVLVGVPWEQHVSFLDDRGRRRSIEHRVQSALDACEGHPAVLGFAIGNEISASIARWYGARRVERFLERLYTLAKRTDADALVTYASFPSTEYLELPFLDFAAFNVYVEQPEQLEPYLARLQTLAGDRPLVIGELGLDSARHGEARQASVVAGQLRTAFEAGCAGAFAFAWTDEWCRSGHDVTDWDFGLVDRDRRPKPALDAVQGVYQPREPFESPRVSVVVCTHNGAATLRECLAGAMALGYPDYEVIVVDDGSTDATAASRASSRCT